jgi:hypothetical protein
MHELGFGLQGTLYCNAAITVCFRMSADLFRPSGPFHLEKRDGFPTNLKLSRPESLAKNFSRSGKSGHDCSYWNIKYLRDLPIGKVFNVTH